MAQITFVTPDGDEFEVDGPEGWTLMLVARQAGIDGIVAECGGACSCATCHVYLDPAFVDRIPPPEPLELGTLQGVRDELKPNSRLSCQVEITEALDGLRVYLPELQA